MNASQLREVYIAWGGPFGKWLTAKLMDEAGSARKNGSEIIPCNMADEYQREHLLAKANALAEFLDSIPTRIKLELKEQETRETRETKEQTS